jgi:zinc transport system ATP-binding protein
MSDTSAMIETRDVCVVRGARHILDRVSIAVRRGQIVTLVGPNGAGKSTLVRIALGLEKPDNGTVVQAPGIRVGYQPQKLSLDDTLPLSVRRFLTLTERHEAARLEQALSEVGVPHLLNASVHTLSGGEWQRVMLARAVLRKPDLLVLDEPTQNVDTAGAAEIYQIIARLRDTTNCAVLMVSHDLNVVMAATDQVYCLNGHVCCAGHPDHVSRHAEFQKLFGPAAAALAIYEHHHDHSHAPDGSVAGACGHDHSHEHGHHHLG